MTEDEAQLENGDADDAAFAPIDFNVFVLSLNTSALIQLGERPDVEGRVQVDLPMARHTIDILCMLDQKTRGNLSGEEEQLLHGALFDLRMRFAHKAAGSK